MDKKILGKTDLEIAPINLGANVFGWTLDEKQSFDILDKFIGAGYNFIDTADMYSYWVDGGNGGQSETIIGNWTKQRGNRHDVVIATKVGGATGTHKEDVSKAHILKAVDASLQRLQTDYIDLYYTHFDDAVTPVEETLEAYDILIKSGKVRHIGASNLTPARLLESLEKADKNGLPAYKVLQPHYNLLERQNFETHFATIAEQYELAVLPYWSLASGFLTGKYRSEADLSKSPRGEGVSKYLNQKGLDILAALDKIAEKYQTSNATIALAWLLSKPLVAAPIVSATSDRQLQTIFAATALSLDSNDIETLDTASAF